MKASPDPEIDGLNRQLAFLAIPRSQVSGSLIPSLGSDKSRIEKKSTGIIGGSNSKQGQ